MIRVLNWLPVRETILCFYFSCFSFGFIKPLLIPFMLPLVYIHWSVNFFLILFIISHRFISEFMLIHNKWWWWLIYNWYVLYIIKEIVYTFWWLNLLTYGHSQDIMIVKVHLTDNWDQCVFDWLEWLTTDIYIYIYIYDAALNMVRLQCKAYIML